MADFIIRRKAYQRYSTRENNGFARLGDVKDLFADAVTVSGAVAITGATTLTGNVTLGGSIAIGTAGVVNALTGALSNAPLVNGQLPATWITYFEDFIVGGSEQDNELASESNGGGMFSELADAAQYLVTQQTTGELQCAKIATGVATGGWIDVLTSATQNRPVNIQANGTPWLLSTGKKLYFETKIMVEDVTECKWFVGLSIANTDILGSNAGTVDDIIGFCGLATTAIQFISNEDGSDTVDATAGTIADGSIATISTKAVTLAFAWDGVDTVTYYIDGTSAGTITTLADDINQDEGMSVAFVCDNTAAGTAERLWIDYIYVAQER